jgi:hypothetical protein
MIERKLIVHIIEMSRSRLLIRADESLNTFQGVALRSKSSRGGTALPHRDYHARPTKRRGDPRGRKTETSSFVPYAVIVAIILFIVLLVYYFHRTAI